ncbi:DUF4174 domain-containing protein [Pseudomonas sp. DWP3-1-2]|uniref:DUF4174 domain-containing protein n=1 Tax=Pseudomonas sp. DWP3-1-2 TaxID=2804645 RepID=UPI003CEBC7D0
MKCLFARLSLFFTIAVATVGVALANDALNPLIAERWKTRPLVIVVPSVNDPALHSLRQALESTSNREAFVERDMVLYAIVAGVGSRNDQPLTPDQTSALINALNVDAHGPAKVILIGKDGGKKVERGGPVKLAEFFVIIDAMPMRQN